MKYILHILPKHLIVLVLGFLPFLVKGQFEDCNFIIPPCSISGIEVTHTLGQNVIILDEYPEWYFCGDSTLIIPAEIPFIILGELIIIDPIIWNPFTYTLNFSKPINGISCVLYVGDKMENLVFKTTESNLNLTSIQACNETISGDTIFLGTDTYPYQQGDGLFSISFDCPVYSFTISGNGAGAGVLFQICSTSLVTPNLWGRVSGDTLLCTQDSVLLEAFGGVAPYTFSYNINGGATQTEQSSTPQVWLPTPTNAGTYTYNLLTVKDGADSLVQIACHNKHTVQVVATPTAQFGLSPQQGIVPFTTQASNTSINANSYTWFMNTVPLGINCPSGSTCPVPLADTGNFVFTLVAANNIGCTDTTQVTLTAFPSFEVVVPNVFSPNNDGVNDFFGITTTVDASVVVSIVNRWGNLVFEQKSETESGQFLTLWDGATKDFSLNSADQNKVSEGTYFYKIKVSQLANGDVKELNGFVQVVW